MQVSSLFREEVYQVSIRAVLDHHVPCSVCEKRMVVPLDVGMLDLAKRMLGRVEFIEFSLNLAGTRYLFIDGLKGCLLDRNQLAFICECIVHLVQPNCLDIEPSSSGYRLGCLCEESKKSI